MFKLPYEEIPVKTLVTPSKNIFNKSVQLAKEPFKVSGSIGCWELFKTLSSFTNSMDQCDYLSTLAPHKKVSFSILPQEQEGMIGLNENLEHNFSFKKDLFPNFMNEVKRYIATPKIGNLYLQSVPIKELGAKLGGLELFKSFVPVYEPRFWIGTGHQCVMLHNDPYRTIMALFAGYKKVIMFPPKELPNIYPAPFHKSLGGVIGSLVNVYDPDFKTHPLFKLALKNVRVALLSPGEFLYVPPMWWHAVEGENFNVSVSCWFSDDLSCNLSQLYLPSESLMLSINTSTIDKLEKQDLYHDFARIIDDGFISFKSQDTLYLNVIKEAQKIKRDIALDQEIL
jgi:hypothetical protein